MRLIARFWAECLLVVIVASSALLALAWVFTVPILQNPDEESHIDYAFTIYSANRLLNVRQAPSEWNVHPRRAKFYEWAGISHLYTLYLMDATDFERVRFHADQKLPANYGTPAYYRKLDDDAPRHPARLPDLGPQDNPWLVTAYPFGYYALLAGWLQLSRLFSSGLVSLFLAARVLSVALGACSLVVTYAMLRELRFSKGRSLVLVALVGFFPMTTFVSSSVQPDNLAWTLMSLCFYLALVLRRQTANTGVMALLGIGLGALLVTKYHFYFLALIPILAMAGAHQHGRRPLRGWLTTSLMLLAPSLLLLSAQYWVTAGAMMTGGSLRLVRAGLLGRLREAVRDYYCCGQAFASWWGTFGWMDTPLVIRSASVQERLLLLLSTLSVGILAMMLLRMALVLRRLVVVGGHGRWRTASRILLSNPLVNSYVIFTAFMIALYALPFRDFSGDPFRAQGRHWLPYIAVSFLIATEYAPRVLSHRRTRAMVSALLTCALALYCVVGSYYSYQVITRRFYLSP